MNSMLQEINAIFHRMVGIEQKVDAANRTTASADLLTHTLLKGIEKRLKSVEALLAEELLLKELISKPEPKKRSKAKGKSKVSKNE